ncbi:MAG: Ribonuclease G [Candidatus Dichloromethanomonas elyunquensis]|nr:MAG: Ribonuclease G [Candidatus Dichloromethanomonas elyunquensis]
MKEIIITLKDNHIRAAVLDGGKLIEVLDDSEKELRLAGSIYKGKVNNIVPGIQAAFIDIGLGKNAFLYVGDVLEEEFAGNEKIIPKVFPSIENYLKEGQEIIVQIVREPVGNKGARVTTHLSLAGRYVVLLPGVHGYIGVSRKIKDEKERQRLQSLGERVKPAEAGLIIRTLAEGVSAKEFFEDVQRLQSEQQEIFKKIEDHTVKGLLYGSNDPFSRLVREIIDDEVDKIMIDNGKTAELLREKLRELGCPAASKIWTDMKASLFERYGIDVEIRNALHPRVPLARGGYLVIEQTEALTAIDVNSGKYTGNNNLEETLLSLNLEAAEEISRQIRLRNLSGIIIIDFIDLERTEDWEKLITTLEKFFERDKVKCKVIGLTKLGLVEVTRKKQGQTLAARYTADCPKCSGRGRLAKR